MFFILHVITKPQCSVSNHLSTDIYYQPRRRHYQLYKIRYKLQNFVLLFVLICHYLTALRVFESFSLLSYGFVFNIKGMNVKIVLFLSLVPGFANRRRV